MDNRQWPKWMLSIPEWYTARRLSGIQYLWRLSLLPILLLGLIRVIACSGSTGSQAEGWKRIILPGPNAGVEQTACIVLDVDADGTDDFIVTERTKTPSVVLYKYNGKGWDQKVVEDSQLNVEAGGEVCDIDADGDVDIIFGQDYSGNAIWWWENPNPDHSKPWTRRFIKNAGGRQHHDQSVADYDGDGSLEFVSWNQKSKELLLFEIPSDPKLTEPWPHEVIFTWESGRGLEGFVSEPVDVDLDGKVDIVGGGRWFKHKGGKEFEPHVIDDAMRFTQCAAGQLVEGGRPEIVFSPGDMDGVAFWYEWQNGRWVPHKLRHVVHGHTCEVRDIDRDGRLDIMIGEMGNPGHGDKSECWIWYGNGQGQFEVSVISRGQGIHEGTLGDFDGDNDLDILLKPYNHNAPGVEILLNPGSRKGLAERWTRHEIGELPDRAIFVEAGDLDGDGWKDLVAGGWWWRNPGSLEGTWQRTELGSPFHNLTALFDFDHDGDLDALGTKGCGAEPSNQHVWAQNNGMGQFEIHENIATGGNGDFLQGRVITNFGAGVQVALSWHNGGGGVQSLTVPDRPSMDPWLFGTLSRTTLKEDLSAGDIDRDGDLDLLLGNQWLQNNLKDWKVYTLGRIPKGEVDRNDLADVNGDGWLDAIVSLENGVDIFWFESSLDPKREWKRHKIGKVAGQGFSMDVADFDHDGDPDVVIGEHRGTTENRVILFENLGKGTEWESHTIDSGPPDYIDHHDGTQAVDLDDDGDLDLISIGWHNPKLWVYEQR